MRTPVIGDGFEGLEDRLLLAGNVLSALNAGVLVLTGDAQANEVQLTVAANGQLTARGLSGTTINGVTSVNFGVVNTLTVDGGAGADKISLNSPSATIANDVTINGGADNDTISIAGRFGADLIIDGGLGLDTISVSKSTVGVDIDLDSGDGNDKVTLSGTTVGRDVLIQSGIDNDSVTLDGMTVKRDLSLADAGGNNSLRLNNTSSRGDTLIVLDDGNDSVVVNGLTAGVKAGVVATGLISIDLGDGINVLTMSRSKALGSAVGDGIILTGGLGDDSLGILDTQSAGTILIDSGDGANKIEMTRVQISGVGALDITTGLGADYVKIDQVIVGGRGTVDTGLEDDILLLTSSRFTGVFSAAMGDGNDTTFMASNFFARAISGASGGLGVDSLTLGANSPNNNMINTLFESTRNIPSARTAVRV